MTLIDTIIFDWDGTIVDTAQNAFTAFQKAFSEMGITLEPERYERIYSPNWHRMYETLQLPREKWRAADDLWMFHYSGEAPRMVSGGAGVLNEFMQRKYLLAVVTSGSRARVLREMNLLGLTGHFQTVICSEDVVHKKPHPEGLLNAMKQLYKHPECCCYVGDSPEDIEMGKRAGVLTVAIPGLYPASKQLLASAPDLWFDSLEEFLESPALKKLQLKP